MTKEQKLIAELDDEVNMGNLETVRRLLEQGADVNGRNVVSETPLMAAAYTGQADMVRLLLEFGAEPNATDSMHFGRKTPLQLAQDLGHEDVIHALSSGGSKAKEP